MSVVVPAGLVAVLRFDAERQIVQVHTAGWLLFSVARVERVEGYELLHGERVIAAGGQRAAVTSCGASLIS